MKGSTNARIMFAVFLCWLPGPLMAGEDDWPSGLACVAASYKAEDVGAVVGPSGELDFPNGEAGLATERFADTVMAAAQRCQARFDWSDESTFQAWMFEMGRLLESIAARFGPFAGRDFERMKADLAAASELQTAIFVDFVKQLNGEPRGLDVQAKQRLEAFARDAGLQPDEAMLNELEALLSAFEMQRMGAKSFAISTGEAP